MALYTFTPFLVLDAQGEPADGAAGQIYALSDTSFETPLDVTDLNGLPLSLTTSADGIVPAFRVEHTEPSVVWRSGGAPTSPMISIEGVLADVAEAKAEATSSAASAEAAQLAAEAATAGAVRTVNYVAPDSNGNVNVAAGGPGGGVTSVNGQAGPEVVLDRADIGLPAVDNTSDAEKPVSTATAAALANKAAAVHVHAMSDVTGLLAALKPSALSWAEESKRGAASYDIPTLAWSASLTTGMTSPVEYRPSVCGTGAQVTGWDGRNDPNFRFFSGSFMTAQGAQSDLALMGEIKPRGASQAARWPIVIEFDTSSGVNQIEVSFYTDIPPYVMMDVNGRAVTDVVEMGPAGLGNAKKVLFTFPVARARRVRIYCTPGLHAVRVPTGQSITKPAETVTRRVAFIGDSWTNGSANSYDYPSGANNVETFAPRLGKMLGAQDMILAGLGGTGFVAGMDGGSPANYATRLDAVLAMDPDVLVVNGSINDGVGGTGVQAAATALLTAAVAVVPEVYCVGTMLQGFSSNHAAVQAAAAAVPGVTFIPMLGFVETGSNASAPNGSGNGDVFLRPDNVHPTLAGHVAISQAIYRQIAG